MYTKREPHMNQEESVKYLPALCLNFGMTTTTEDIPKESDYAVIEELKTQIKRYEDFFDQYAAKSAECEIVVAQNENLEALRLQLLKLNLEASELDHLRQEQKLSDIRNKFEDPEPEPKAEPKTVEEFSKVEANRQYRQWEKALKKRLHALLHPDKCGAKFNKPNFDFAAHLLECGHLTELEMFLDSIEASRNKKSSKRSRKDAYEKYQSLVLEYQNKLKTLQDRYQFLIQTLEARIVAAYNQHGNTWQFERAVSQMLQTNIMFMKQNNIQMRQSMGMKDDSVPNTLYKFFNL